MKALILGKGVSGRAAGKLLKSLSIEFSFYQDGESFPKGRFDFAVKSPGIPPYHEAVRELKRRKVKVYGEVELAYRFLKGTLVGITGTNGKSTTTALVYNALKETGRRSFIGGNFGTPPSSFALETDGESFVVLELSSFQIEDLISFKGEVGAILNVTPDHLDRYSSFSQYLNSKIKVFKHFDFVVINGDDENLKPFKKKEGAITFGLKEGDFRIEGNSIKGDGLLIELKELPLKGVHNAYNYLCSAAILRLLGLSEDEILKGFNSFRGLPHRNAFVSRINGVDFVNDSKATNVDSVEKALLSYSKVVLIAGGKDKGLDFSPLKGVVKEKVRALVAIGETGEKLKETFSNLVPVELAESMEEAVRKAFKRAEKGDTVLLSPGCSSFDMFKSYEERGEVFEREVLKLKEEVEGA
ncbi:UDP-N-acetylmuramoyl-L-alanine--D-glutamate ligase [Thermovibrio sp.]